MAQDKRVTATRSRPYGEDAAELSEALSRLLTFDELSAEQRELFALMSDISESCYCAGWMIGNEHAIWRALQTGERRHGAGEIDPEQLQRCRELSEHLCGWIAWVDDSNVPDMPSEQWGVRFVPMDLWLRLVELSAR